jgi:nucleoside-diphosphate-sugar epimerase
VYGEDISGDVIETTAISPDTGSARANAAIETHIRSHYSNPYTILRLAGLVGPDRHPIASLQGRQLSDADRPVNLVHVDDVVRALERLHVLGGKSNTLHLCCREHPSRQDYYTLAALQRGLTPPTFSSSHHNHVGKRINADMTWQYLQLEPAYPSPFSM